MRKIFIILGLLLPLCTSAQELTYGLTGHVGAFHTIVHSKQPALEDSYEPKIGGQLELGAWSQKEIGAAGYVQLTLLHGLERQGGGTITLYDVNSVPIGDAKTRYGNLSLGITGQYFYKLTENVSLGAGLGAKYKYFSIVGIQLPQYPGSEASDNYYNNYHHYRLQLYMPLELQRKISTSMALIGQVQLPLSSKIDNTSAFREYDLGLNLGVNYSFR